MKICNICHVSKILDDFYKHKGCADGHIGQCKKCCIEKSNAYRKTESGRISLSKSREAESYKAKRKIFMQTDQWKLSQKNSAKKFQLSYPKKYQANYKLKNAVKLGHIKKEPCFICGDVKSEGHHSDYDAPLSVTWLCRKHHLEVHKMISKFERLS